MGVNIDFKFPDWAGKVKRQEERINRFIAAQVQTNRGMLFENEGGYNGHAKWASLRFRNGQVLSRRGTLRKSIAPHNPKGSPGPDGIVRFAGDEITVGTKLFYARMMNNGTTGLPGGVLRPKRAKALKIPLPAGEWANKAARELRASRVTDGVMRARDGVTDARETLAKRRQALQKALADESKPHTRKGDTKGKRSNKTLKAQQSVERAEAAIRRREIALGKVEAKRAKIIQTGKGGENFIFRKWVRIPPRDFESWNENDQAELDAALSNLIVGILNG